MVWNNSEWRRNMKTATSLFSLVLHFVIRIFQKGVNWSHEVWSFVIGVPSHPFINHSVVKTYREVLRYARLSFFQHTQKISRPGPHFEVAAHQKGEVFAKKQDSWNIFKFCVMLQEKLSCMKLSSGFVWCCDTVCVVWNSFRLFWK